MPFKDMHLCLSPVSMCCLLSSLNILLLSACAAFYLQGTVPEVIDFLSFSETKRTLYFFLRILAETDRTSQEAKFLPQLTEF